MKITFEVPDTTRAAFRNIVFSHDDKMMLSGIAADSEEIERHDVIKFREIKDCDGCRWRDRPQKCSCCRRNADIKDCYEKEANQ